MLLRDKALYHQIHPIKLATDIVTAVASFYLFWRHELILGLIIHVVPSVIVSAAVMRLCDLEDQRNSAFGRYVARHMSRSVEAVRFGGDIVSVFGAWHRSWTVVAAGVLIVILAWLAGLVRAEPTS